MKRNWSEPELDEIWLLSPTDLGFLTNKSPSGRLGVALQLKMLPFAGRFFEAPSELAPVVVRFVAQQVGVHPKLLNEYDVAGRNAKRDRTAIRKHLGWHQATEADHAAMEVAQARMLQETDAAREGLRQAEQKLVKIQQRSEEQQVGLTELRLEVARHQRELAKSETDVKSLADVKIEHDKLTLELATLRGQLAGMTMAMRSAEARAIAAEARLAAAQTPSRKRRRSG